MAMTISINPAAELAKLRRGVKERRSLRKRRTARENLQQARATWQAMKPEDRKRSINTTTQLDKAN